MKFKDLKIGVQLTLGFTVMLLFVIVLSFVSFKQNEQLHGQFETLYNHPFKVREALGNLEADILTMRLATRDLMLATNEDEKVVARQHLEVAKAGVEKEFKIIHETYLGPKRDVDAAYKAFLNWNTARQENLKAIENGNIEEVKESVRSTGSVGALRDDMLNKINVISEFAIAKAKALDVDSDEVKSKLINQLWIITLVFVLISVFIIYYLLRSVRSPIKHLTDVIARFKNGDFNAHSDISLKNEFGILSNTYNELIDQINEDMELSRQTAELSDSMLVEDNSHRFFMELLPVFLNLTNSQLAAVYLLDEEQKKFVLYESIGMTSEFKNHSFDADMYEGQFGRVLTTKEIERVVSIPLDTNFAFQTVSGAMVPREIISIPILVGEEIVAIISLASIRKYSDKSIRLINKTYDVLTARVDGILAYRELRKSAKILEQQKEELAKAGTYNRCLIEASIDPLVTIGPDGRITDVNKSTEFVTGCTREELIGTDFANYFTEPDRATEVYLKVFNEGAVHDYELMIKHVNGSIIPVLYNASIYRDEKGAVVGVFAAARDISEAKRIEKELVDLNDALNHRSENLVKANNDLEMQKTELAAQSTELMQQNSELEMQKKKLDEVSRLKTNFLSNMSHELRTPLNSVIALSGVLSRRLVKSIPADEYSYIEVIERNGKHLLSLINDILDISRIEAGREEVEIEKFNADDLVADIVGMIEPQAKQKNIGLIHLLADEKIMLKSDSRKIKHILQNLIGNAVKFTETGKVEVSVQKENSHLVVKIADTGIGISQENISHIFDEFRQADGSTSRRFGGTGLGLAIAQKYAMLLGGRVNVSSVINKGSTFVLTLPLNYSNIKQEIVDEVSFNNRIESNEHVHISGQGKTVLLVEDSEPAVIQIKDFLEQSGYKIFVADSGAKALEMVTEIDPDGIILDLMMPGIDGFEVLKVIREAESTAKIPVLILSAKHITKDELKFLKRNNIHQLIQKGDVNKAELISAIANMVNTQVDVFPKTEETKVFQEITGKPIVLVVEDNVDNMITVKAILGNNYTVIEAIDGIDGVEMAKKHKPNLILMDIALPQMDGVAAFKIIRSDINLKSIPVIALTASAMINDREVVLAHGFDAYLVKPIDESLFFKTINEVLYGK